MACSYGSSALIAWPWGPTLPAARASRAARRAWRRGAGVRAARGTPGWSREGGREQGPVAQPERAGEVGRGGPAGQEGGRGAIVVDEKRGGAPPRLARRPRTNSAAREADEAPRHGPRALPRPPGLGTRRCELALGGDERVCGRGPRGAHVIPGRRGTSVVYCSRPETPAGWGACLSPNPAIWADR